MFVAGRPGEPRQLSQGGGSALNLEYWMEVFSLRQQHMPENVRSKRWRMRLLKMEDKGEKGDKEDKGAKCDTGAKWILGCCLVGGGACLQLWKNVGLVSGWDSYPMKSSTSVFLSSLGQFRELLHKAIGIIPAMLSISSVRTYLHLHTHFNLCLLL